MIKKLFFILLIIAGSILLLLGLFILGDIAINKTVYNTGGKINSPSETAFTALIMAGVGLLMIIAPLRKLRYKRIDTSTITYDPFHLQLNFILPFNDYARMSLISLFRGWYRYLSILWLILILHGISNYEKVNILPLLFLVVLFLGIPASVYFNAKRIYSTSVYLGKEIKFDIDENRILSEGATFRSENQWSHVVRAVETKDYFMLFTSKVTALLLAKEYFPDVASVQNLRNFLLIRNILKKGVI